MVIAVTNQKGGVGKTTIAINLSVSLALLDYRVLVIDIDPQGNSSDGMGINTNKLDNTIYDVLINDVPLSDVVIPKPPTSLSFLSLKYNSFAHAVGLNLNTGCLFF